MGNLTLKQIQLLSVELKLLVVYIHKLHLIFNTKQLALNILVCCPLIQIELLKMDVMKREV